MWREKIKKKKLQLKFWLQHSEVLMAERLAHLLHGARCLHQLTRLGYVLLAPFLPEYCDLSVHAGLLVRARWVETCPDLRCLVWNYIRADLTLGGKWEPVVPGIQLIWKMVLSKTHVHPKGRVKEVFSPKIHFFFFLKKSSVRDKNKPGKNSFSPKNNKS